MKKLMIAGVAEALAQEMASGKTMAAGKITKAQADALLQAGPRFAGIGLPGPRPMMGPAYGARPGMRGRPGFMGSGGMFRYGPGRQP